MKIIGTPRYVTFLKLLLEENSISQAARETNISYRKAWEIVEILRDFFGKEVIRTQIGGSRGGGTYLSPEGTEIIKYLISINENFAREMDLFLHSDKLDPLMGLLKRYRLRTSARNQLFGEVSDIVVRGITSVIYVNVNDVPFKVLITEKSRSELGLKIGTDVYLLIKAPQVRLNCPADIVENRFEGRIERIIREETEEEGLNEVETKIKEKITLVSITRERNLDLRPGDTVSVCIPPNEIIIGI